MSESPLKIYVASCTELDASTFICTATDVDKIPNSKQLTLYHIPPNGGAKKSQIILVLWKINPDRRLSTEIRPNDGIIIVYLPCEDGQEKAVHEELEALNDQSFKGPIVVCPFVKSLEGEEYEFEKTYANFSDKFYCAGTMTFTKVDVQSVSFTPPPHFVVPPSILDLYFCFRHSMIYLNGWGTTICFIIRLNGQTTICFIIRLNGQTTT